MNPTDPALSGVQAANLVLATGLRTRTIIIIIIIIIIVIMALAQNPISTLSHIWVCVRQYGIMFVIIVIIIIIIIIYRKVKVSTL